MLLCVWRELCPRLVFIIKVSPHPPSWMGMVRDWKVGRFPQCLLHWTAPCRAPSSRQYPSSEWWKDNPVSLWWPAAWSQISQTMVWSCFIILVVIRITLGSYCIRRFPGPILRNPESVARVQPQHLQLISRLLRNFVLWNSPWEALI